MTVSSIGRQADWRRANQRKYECHLLVQAALNAGVLTRGPCETCGAVHGNGVRVDAHHPSYDLGEELNVRWLCRRHHSRLHSGGEDLFGKNTA